MRGTTKHNWADGKYMLVTLVAVLLSWVLHELAHWLTGTALGNEMAMTLNSTFPVSRIYPTNTDAIIVSSAGPLFTMLQAIVIFGWMRKRSNRFLYPFLFTCFYMRLMAMGLSFINPNDEARVSNYISIGTFTLPLLITAFLFYLVYIISKQYGFSRRFNAITTGLVILFSSVIILFDQALHIRLL